jgi:hypothetical protein
MSDEPVAEFFKMLEESLSGGSFVKLSLGKYRGAEAGLKNVYVRLVKIKNSDRLSFLYRFQTKDATKNYAIERGLEELRQLLGASFLNGHLFTLTRDLQLEFNRKLRPRLISSKPTFSALPPATHDQPKQRFVEPEGNVYLRALGVTNERAQVREKMGDKFRQINKFVEIVGGLFVSSQLSQKRDITIVDMGSGKGYLTFAVYDYFKHRLGIEARVTGVEARPELVSLCNDIARRAGFTGLQFQPGYINDYQIEQADILIALHACDTATDDALYRGIKSGASIIISAPCCHKEIRPQIETPPILNGVLRHGILLERQSEMLTDALRALLLEYSGYTTKVFEFISTEHTAKNTMIVGVRQPGTDRADALRQINELKNFYGIKEQRLERLLLGPSRAIAEPAAPVCDPA